MASVHQSAQSHWPEADEGVSNFKNHPPLLCRPAAQTKIPLEGCRDLGAFSPTTTRSCMWLLSCADLTVLHRSLCLVYVRTYVEGSKRVSRAFSGMLMFRVSETRPPFHRRCDCHTLLPSTPGNAEDRHLPDRWPHVLAACTDLHSRSLFLTPAEPCLLFFPSSKVKKVGHAVSLLLISFHKVLGV